MVSGAAGSGPSASDRRRRARTRGPARRGRASRPPRRLLCALHDIYEPWLLTIEPHDEDPAICLRNDTDEAVNGRLRLRRHHHDGTVLATGELDLRVAARTAATLPVPPAQFSQPDDPASEVLLVALKGTDVRTVHCFAEDRDSTLAGGVVAATAQRVEGGVEIAVSASSTVRELCVPADTIDPDAMADRQLITLLAGESASIRVSTTADIEASAFSAHHVLLSANDLVARGMSSR